MRIRRVSALWQTSLTFCALPLLSASIIACSPPADRPYATKAAISQLINQSFSSPQPAVVTYGRITSQLAATQVVNSRVPCEGAAGSVMLPLGVYCLDTLMAPMLPIGELFSSLGIAPPLHAYHVYLSGVAQYFVHQSEPNDCWAAALTTTRDFLHLPHITQTTLLSSAAKFCPLLPTQNRGADAYQIIYTIKHVLLRYDESRTSPHFCINPPCLIASLVQGHPIILLGNDHTVLLVGVDYVLSPSKSTPTPTITLQRLYLLDPAGNGLVETSLPAILCRVDVAIAY